MRDWLFVKDHCRGIDVVFHSCYFGESFNIGGGNEKSNIELAQMICKVLDEKYPKEKSYKGADYLCAG